MEFQTLTLWSMSMKMLHAVPYREFFPGKLHGSLSDDLLHFVDGQGALLLLLNLFQSRIEVSYHRLQVLAQVLEAYHQH